MLVTFRSTATGSITMFGDTAKQLLSMMGASGRIPGAFVGEDVGDALGKLESSLSSLRSQTTDHQTPAPPAVNEDMEAEEEEDQEPPVAIAVRAAPLLDLLRQASAAKAEVSWE